MFLEATNCVLQLKGNIDITDMLRKAVLFFCISEQLYRPLLEIPIQLSLSLLC